MRKRFSLILATALLCVGNLVAQGLSHNLTIGESKYATMMLGFNAKIPEGVKAYVAASVSDGYVHFSEVEGNVIAASTPVLLKAEVAGNYAFAPTEESAVEVGNNLLEGVLYNKSVSMSSDYNYYVFDEGECVWLPAVAIEGGTEVYFSATANTAYLQVPTTMAESYSSLSIATVTASGSCGENLTWVLSYDGELTILGTGAMTDYESHSAPWFSYKDDIKTVTINPGVTTIGKYAIGDCSNLTTVTIPEGVTSIGLQAFQYCYKLTSVTLSDGLKTIDWGAFAECHELPSIDIPEGVTTIGNYAFTHCYKLSSVTIPESVTSIGIYAFRNTAITSVVIPANISSLSQGTFENCPNLSSIICKAETPPSVGHSETFYNVNRSIPVYVPVSAVAAYKEAEGWKEFTNIQPMGTCGDNLTWRITPEDELIVEGAGEMTSAPWFDIEKYRYAIKKATIMEGVTSIADAAFHYCTALTSISIPESVTSLGNHTFNSCSSLTAVTIPEGVTSIGEEVFQHCENLTEVSIPEGVTSIGYFAFQNCKLSTITIPENVSSIGHDAFDGCRSLVSMTCRATIPPVLESSAFNNVNKSIPLYVPVSAVAAYKEAEGWKEFTNIRPMGTCEDNLTWMLTAEGELIIEGTGAMTDYSYGNWAPWYDYRESILSINIGEGVTTIANQTFRDCTGLTTVTIPACVTTIGEAAFYNCPGLATANIAEDSQLESIGYNAFLGCKSLTAFTIPATVTSIGEHAFHGCEKLPSVTIPANIKTIESRAFQDCRKFNTITIPAGVTTIKDCAFYGCENLEAVIFPENSQLTTIGTEAFYNCQKLSSIIIPASVTTMGEGVFKSCTGLISATIPAGVTTIEYETFESCSSLTNVTFPENSQLTTIGTDAFWDSGLASITIPANVTTIGTDAFRYCDNLTSVIIPDNSQLTTIGFASFLGCSALTSITLPASLTSLDMGAFKGCTGLTTMTCNATTPPAVNSSETFYNINRSIPVYVPASAVAAYKEADYWKEFTNIQAPIIDSGTCGENLTWKINGAYELTIEGMGAMYNYSNNSAAPWQNYKGSIKSIDIKDGVTSVGSWAFSQCPILTDVSIAESVTSIGGDAFRECSILEEITLPKGLTELGTGVFLYCSALKSITVPEGVTIIGSDTFEFCPQLSSITFPSGLTEIGPWALKGAYSLTSITCKAATPPSLGNEVFSGVSYDITVYVPTSSVEAYKTAEGWNQFANIQPIILGSGTCGDDLAWKLTDEGKLTIEGTGAMTSTPWKAYTESIKVITIKEGVTTICDRAFEGCNQVETMIIPKGVNEIGMDAFWDCTGVLYLNSMPVTGDYMMGGAFSGSRFTKVVISDDITEIKDMAFFYMTSLTEVVLPENLQRIGEMAFSGCRSITTITIPESVTTIGNYAFEMCEGLTSITCRTATPPSCGYEVFYAVGKSIPLYVSLDAIDEYQSAEQWKEFACIVGTAKCGETLTGELWPDGKLTVKGEGAITTAPWEAYGEQVKELVLEEEVTSIADESFLGLSNLLSITSYAKNPPVCSTHAFNGVARTTPVYVVPDKLEDYSVSEGWCEFTYLTSNDSRVLLDSYAAYSHEEDESFEEITYVRTFNNTHWQALYVPFEIPYEAISQDFHVADINDIRQYDLDDDGMADETVVEAFKITTGTLKANYPYLIRAKENGENYIILTDATLYTTEENSIDCSSVHEKYTFSSTYSTLSTAELSGCYVLNDGEWKPAAENTSLGAFRFYLKIEDRDGGVPPARSIKMRIVGDDNTGGDTTGIDNAEHKTQDLEHIYDLQGRRILNAKNLKGLFIVNGRKVVIK